MNEIPAMTINETIDPQDVVIKHPSGKLYVNKQGKWYESNTSMTRIISDEMLGCLSLCGSSKKVKGNHDTRLICNKDVCNSRIGPINEVKRHFDSLIDGD